MHEGNKYWYRFKHNKRGYVSFIIFVFLFFITLFAELIANDKPLLIIHQGEYYTPFLKFYPETVFGGDFDTEADFTDLFVRNLVLDNGGKIFEALIPFSYDTIDTNELHPAPAPPSMRHWLGTDDRQRDVLARSIYGFRISILFGLILTICASFIGITAGAIQGYFGGKIDLFGQRFIEMWSSMPSLYILIILSSLLVPNFWILLGIMVLFSWTILTGVVRAEFLRTRNFDFVKAARTMGISDISIMFRHILPNAMTAAMAILPFVVSGATIKLASLDFLGLGLPPGSPSLGELVLQGKNNLDAPWLGITAFIVMGGMLTMLVFIGEAVRNTFDPRKVLT
jgi:microcin C transport system permease protein